MEWNDIVQLCKIGALSQVISRIGNISIVPSPSFHCTFVWFSLYQCRNFYWNKKFIICAWQKTASNLGKNCVVCFTSAFSLVSDARILSGTAAGRKWGSLYGQNDKWSLMTRTRGQRLSRWIFWRRLGDILARAGRTLITALQSE